MLFASSTSSSSPFIPSWGQKKKLFFLCYTLTCDFFPSPTLFFHFILYTVLPSSSSVLFHNFICVHGCGCEYISSYKAKVYNLLAFYCDCFSFSFVSDGSRLNEITTLVYCANANNVGEHEKEMRETCIFFLFFFCFSIFLRLTSYSNTVAVINKRNWVPSMRLACFVFRLQRAHFWCHCLHLRVDCHIELLNDFDAYWFTHIYSNFIINAPFFFSSRSRYPLSLFTFYIRYYTL